MQIAFSADYEKSKDLFAFSNGGVPFRKISAIVENLNEGVKKNIRSSGNFKVRCVHIII